MTISCSFLSKDPHVFGISLLAFWCCCLGHSSTGAALQIVFGFISKDRKPGWCRASLQLFHQRTCPLHPGGVFIRAPRVHRRIAKNRHLAVGTDSIDPPLVQWMTRAMTISVSIVFYWWLFKTKSQQWRWCVVIPVNRPPLPAVTAALSMGRWGRAERPGGDATAGQVAFVMKRCTVVYKCKRVCLINIDNLILASSSTHLDVKTWCKFTNTPLRQRNYMKNKMEHCVLSWALQHHKVETINNKHS